MLFNKKVKNEMDEESKKLWESFRMVEAPWCCKVFKEMRGAGVRHIHIMTPGNEAISMLLNYCPRCGGKIE